MKFCGQMRRPGFVRIRPHVWSLEARDTVQQDVSKETMTTYPALLVAHGSQEKDLHLY
jgi:hypothetical protein